MSSSTVISVGYLVLRVVCLCARASFIFLRNAAAVCAGQRKLIYDCGLDFTAAAAAIVNTTTCLQSVDICRVTVFFEVYNFVLMSILLSVLTVVITDKLPIRSNTGW